MRGLFVLTLKPRLGSRLCQVFEGEESVEGGDGGTPKRRRNKKNRYGMTKTSGRRFRAERMNIFGMRKTTEFSIDEVRRQVAFETNGTFQPPCDAVNHAVHICFERCLTGIRSLPGSGNSSRDTC